MHEPVDGVWTGVGSDVEGVGKTCGKLVGAKAELLGGLILIGVAANILYSHLQ